MEAEARAKGSERAYVTGAACHGVRSSLKIHPSGRRGEMAISTMSWMYTAGDPCMVHGNVGAHAIWYRASALTEVEYLDILIRSDQLDAISADISRTGNWLRFLLSVLTGQIIHHPESSSEQMAPFPSKYRVKKLSTSMPTPCRRVRP